MTRGSWTCSTISFERSSDAFVRSHKVRLVLGDELSRPCPDLALISAALDLAGNSADDHAERRRDGQPGWSRHADIRQALPSKSSVEVIEIQADRRAQDEMGHEPVEADRLSGSSHRRFRRE